MATRKKVTGGIHWHQCRNCPKRWKCKDHDAKHPERSWRFLPLDKCGITIAAKVNRDGPYCDRCREREIKKRIQELRKKKS